MHSGKDTIADFLKQKFGMKKVALASHLKSAVSSMFGFDESQIHGNNKDFVDPRWGIAPRRAMQYIGTDVMQFHAHHHLFTPSNRCFPFRRFWVQRLLHDMASEPLTSFVICDVRFPHEVETLKEQLGDRFRTIGIKRAVAAGSLGSVGSFDGEEHEANTSVHREKNHSSETELEQIECDVLIENNDDLLHLERRVECLPDMPRFTDLFILRSPRSGHRYNK
jgi:hypothetical protein